MFNLKNMLLIFICAALLLPLSIFYRVLYFHDVPTLPRKITWTDVITGDVIPVKETDDSTDWRGCSHIKGYRFLAGEKIWLICDYPEGNASMALIDPTRLEGKIWKIPNELELPAPWYLEGLAYHQDGKLAIVYNPNGKIRKLAYAVIDDSGWVVEPKRIEDEGNSRLKAVIWEDNTLEIVYHSYKPRSGDESYYSPNLISIDGDQITNRKSHPIKSKFCKIDRYNCVWPCKVFSKGGKWHSVYQRHQLDGLPHSYLIIDEEGGEDELLGNELHCPAGHYLPGGFLETSVLGVLDDKSVYLYVGDNTKQTYSMTNRQGGIELLIPIHEGWNTFSSNHWFTLDSQTLKRETLWLTDERHVYARPNPESLENPNDWLFTKNEGHNLLAWFGDYDEASGETSDKKYIAKSDDYYCGDIEKGIHFKNSAGGYWWITDSGCYLELDQNFNRVDGLSLYKHLRSRGGRGLEIDSVVPVYQFYWVLLGLPVLLGLMWMYSRWNSKDLYKNYMWGTLIYLTSGLACWSKVYPLLY